MEIIKRGKIPHYKYKFKCNECKTVFIAEKEELKKFGITEPFKYAVCPVCDEMVAKNIFTKEIKYFEEE